MLATPKWHECISFRSDLFTIVHFESAFLAILIALSSQFHYERLGSQGVLIYRLLRGMWGKPSKAFTVRGARQH